MQQLAEWLKDILFIVTKSKSAAVGSGLLGHKILLHHSLKDYDISLQPKGHDHVGPNQVLHF